jgi:hypothetical protein
MRLKQQSACFADGDGMIRLQLCLQPVYRNAAFWLPTNESALRAWSLDALADIWSCQKQGIDDVKLRISCSKYGYLEGSTLHKLKPLLAKSMLGRQCSRSEVFITGQLT